MLTVPFSDKFITLYFEKEEDKCYDIDYKSSTLNNDAFINYIYNVSIPTNVYIDKDLNYEEKSKLMLAWLHNRNLVPIDTFSQTLLSIILTYREQNTSDIFSFFSKDESEKFINENQKLFDLIICFLDSILFHVQVMYDVLDKSECKYLYDRVDAIPKNLVNIFQINDFHILYYSKESHAPIWFKQQFEGQNALIKYFYIKKNPITAFIEGIIKEKITADNYLEFIKGVDEIIQNAEV